MRERDRELKRRRHRRTKRLKKRHNEEALHRAAERPTGSKRSVKKAPPSTAEATPASKGKAATAGPAEEAAPTPKKRPAAKKAPARKAPEGDGGNAGGSPGPEEPQGS